MEEFRDIAALRAWRAERRRAGDRVGLVPTMGALHEGHLALVDEARRQAAAVVMSIFVNPLQFGPGEDYSRYPRDLDRDRTLAAGRGVVALFTPGVEVIYPPGSETRVVPGATADRWEGAVRPGHFAGVLTVVAKLFHLVEPDVAVFGQKDIQQATLIRRMIRDLDFHVEFISTPTVRESDGLALSSRNAYLDDSQRQQARALNLALRAADAAWHSGIEDSALIDRLLRQQFLLFPAVTIDYIAIVDPENLAPVEHIDRGTIIAVAGRIGSTRLLDNHILGTEFR
ncbi:MAG: pantoate--beta-alanine ligase [Gemmatimonadota bacterium]